MNRTGASFVVRGWVTGCCLLLFLAGCAPGAAPVVPTNIPIESLTPTAAAEDQPSLAPTPTAGLHPAVIDAYNAIRLTKVAQFTLVNPYRLSWSLDSRLLGALHPEGLMLWNTETLAVEANAVVQSPVALLDYSPETRLMATTLDQKTIELRQVTTAEMRHTLNSDAPFMAAFFDPAGERLAVSSLDAIAVTVWDTASGVPQQTLSGFETAAPVYSGRFSADGRFLIWVSRATVQVMEIASGTMGAQLSHEDFVTDVALAPGGSILAAGTTGSVGEDIVPFVQLWDAASGEALDRLLLEREAVYSLAFNSDGSLLAAGVGSEVIIWDVSTRKKLLALGGHQARLTSVAFSPDGSTLASAAEDGTVRLWRVQP